MNKDVEGIKTQEVSSEVYKKYKNRQVKWIRSIEELK